MRDFRNIAMGLALAASLAACGPKEDPTKNSQNSANNVNSANAQNSADLCENVSCPALGDTCVGQIATTYSGSGTCAVVGGAAMCNYDNVTNSTDCTQSGQSCVQGACVDIDDVCANVTCDTPPVAPNCEGDTAVSFGNGSCDTNTGLCDYSGAEMRVDCAAMSQVCSSGMCIASTPTPNPGDLVITEIMANPRGGTPMVMDNAGEWIELYNASTRELDLAGLTIKDDGSDSFALPAGTPVPLAAGAYYVLGINGDMATNGGVAVDMVYMGLTMANGADEVVLVNAAMVEVDRVAYDDAAGWIVPNGASMQFGSNADTATDDNNDAQFWCASTTALTGGDFGTPGAANTSCGPGTVTLYEISNDADAGHPLPNSQVNVTGVVITALNAASGFMWAQEPAGGPYSGVYVDPGTANIAGLAVGDVVDIAGTYDEYFDLARITATAITDTGNNLAITPVVLDTRDLADIAVAETWESVLVQINEAGITDIDLGNGEILIDNNVLANDLLYTDFTANAVECQVYASLVGPLNYSFGAFKIEPRNAGDVGAATTAMPTTAVTQAGMAFMPAAICITAGDTVTWTNNDALGHTITERLASQTSTNDANIPTTPLFDEMLLANSTAAVTFANPGTFHYRCRPHSTMEGVVVAPNP